MIKSIIRSTLKNNIWYRNMLAGNSGFVSMPAYELLETVSISSTTSNVNFSNLNSYSVYKHLQVRIVSTTGGPVQARMRFNGDTGTNYSKHALHTGNPLVSSGETSTDHISFGDSSGLSGHIIDILDFNSTSKNKTVKIFNGNTGWRLYLQSGLWRNTSAITSIDFFYAGASFTAGSRISLYGVKA